LAVLNTIEGFEREINSKNIDEYPGILKVRKIKDYFKRKNSDLNELYKLVKQNYGELSIENLNTQNNKNYKNSLLITKGDIGEIRRYLRFIFLPEKNGNANIFYQVLKEYALSEEVFNKNEFEKRCKEISGNGKFRLPYFSTTMALFHFSGVVKAVDPKEMNLKPRNGKCRYFKANKENLKKWLKDIEWSG